MFNSRIRGRDAANNVALTGASYAQAGKRGAFSLFGTDVTLTGNLIAIANLHIDGRILGDVACCNLVQGKDSGIIGSVTAETARIAGTITGSVTVRQLTVQSAARITGDVEYETITVEQGASIDGRLKQFGAAVRDTAEEPLTVTPSGQLESLLEQRIAIDTDGAAG